MGTLRVPAGGRSGAASPAPCLVPFLTWSLSLTRLMQNHLWGWPREVACSPRYRCTGTSDDGRGLNRASGRQGRSRALPAACPCLPASFWDLTRNLPQVTCSLWASFSFYTNCKIYLLLFTVYTWSFTLMVSFDPQSPARGPHAPIRQWRTLRLGGGTVHQMGQQGSRTQRGPPLPSPPRRPLQQVSPVGSHAVNKDAG